MADPRVMARATRTNRLLNEASMLRQAARIADKMECPSIASSNLKLAEILETRAKLTQVSAKGE